MTRYFQAIRRPARVWAFVTPNGGGMDFPRIPDAEDIYHHRPPLSIFLSLLPVGHIFGDGELVQKFKAEPTAALFVVDIMMKQATAIFCAVEK